MEKYELLPEQLLYEGTVSDANFFIPDQLSRDEILLTHQHDYLHKLETLSLSKKEVRQTGFPISKRLVERGKYISKATYLCAKYAIDNGVAMNIAGGTHHAFPDRGEGFCLFNDIAIAANMLLSRQEREKVLVIDLDVHQGNGNAFIFKDDPRVFTFSMHGEKNYPLRKENSSLDIGFADKIEDQHYLRTLHNQIPKVIGEFQPDMIFYQSGVDILASDKLGRLSITRDGCKERDRFVLAKAKENKIPIVAVMGGGYSHKISDIIDAHANTFRQAQSIFF